MIAGARHWLWYTPSLKSFSTARLSLFSRRPLSQAKDSEIGIWEANSPTPPGYGEEATGIRSPIQDILVCRTEDAIAPNSVKIGAPAAAQQWRTRKEFPIILSGAKNAKED